MVTDDEVLTPEVVPVGEARAVWETGDLLQVRGCYAADWDLALQAGGGVVSEMLQAVPPERVEAARERGLVPNIDVRVHQLKQGDYPATPGWHCDEARRETEFAPGATKTTISDTILVWVADKPSGVSSTEWWPHPIRTHLQEGSDTQRWADVNEQLLGRGGRCGTPGVAYSMGTQTVHRATPAVEDGTRVLLRMSFWTPPPGHQGGVSHSEQVYRLVRR